MTREEARLLAKAYGRAFYKRGRGKTASIYMTEYESSEEDVEVLRFDCNHSIETARSMMNLTFVRSKQGESKKYSSSGYYVLCNGLSVRRMTRVWHAEYLAKALNKYCTDINK